MHKTIKFTSRGKEVNAEFYDPQVRDSAGVVVIAYGTDGLTNDRSGEWETMIRGYADAIADLGFYAIIPDYLSATDTSPGPAALDFIPRYRDSWQVVLSDAIDHATSISGVDAARIGLLGFSLGGHLCLRLRSKAKLLVEYFSPVLEDFGGIGSSLGLQRAQIHHGEADGLVNFRNAGAIEATLKAEGVETELFGYEGADHGFGGMDKANKEAIERSKNLTLGFFKNYL